MRPLCLLLLLAGISLGPLLPGVDAGEPRVTRKDTTFESGKKKIRLEYYLPAGKGPHPAVILLHDAAGLNGLAGLVFRACCQRLATEGYVAVLVHYFDATGTRSIRAEDVRKEEKAWQAWLVVVRDALAHVAQHDRVHADRVGLLGFSLGAYLSLAAATEKANKVCCVAEFYGGLPDYLWKDCDKLHLPPTLIVHGRKDQIVPVREAFALKTLFEERKAPFEMKCYPCDHLFRGVPWKLPKLGAAWDMDGDLADARDLTLKFFARYLKARTKP